MNTATYTHNHFPIEQRTPQSIPSTILLSIAQEVLPWSVQHLEVISPLNKGPLKPRSIPQKVLPWSAQHLEVRTPRGNFPLEQRTPQAMIHSIESITMECTTPPWSAQHLEVISPLNKGPLKPRSIPQKVLPWSAQHLEVSTAFLLSRSHEGKTHLECSTIKGLGFQLKKSSY